MSTSSVRQTDLQNLAKILSEAVTLINRMCNVGSNPAKASKPELYKASGRLNEDGISYIFAMYNDGNSVSEVHREMGITYRAAQIWHEKWQDSKTLAAPEAKPEPKAIAKPVVEKTRREKITARRKPLAIVPKPEPVVQSAP